MMLSKKSILLSDGKYLLAYIVPLASFISIYFGGWASLTALLFIFGFIPIMEHIWPKDKSNPFLDVEKDRSKHRFFDLLLFSNIPIVYGLLIFTISKVESSHLSTIELLGYITALGITLGACGINVAHELGHREGFWNKFAAAALLLPSHYLHFTIEHNLGHHKYVSTPKDPATARYNENVYSFWIRSTIQSYLSAWQLEKRKLEREGKKIWHMHNRMLLFTLVQLLYVLTLFTFVSSVTAIVVILSGIVGFLLLETINYIEHYGLVRKQLASGRYEPILPIHSWNADYPIGRILLYELTRHSDHHYKADRKYQILRSMPESPELPWGYPGSMVIALIPPLWFYYMNPRVQETGSPQAAF